MGEVTGELLIIPTRPSQAKLVRR